MRVCLCVLSLGCQSSINGEVSSLLSSRDDRPRGAALRKNPRSIRLSCNVGEGPACSGQVYTPAYRLRAVSLSIVVSCLACHRICCLVATSKRSEAKKGTGTSLIQCPMPAWHFRVKLSLAIQACRQKAGLGACQGPWQLAFQ